MTVEASTRDAPKMLVRKDGKAYSLYIYGYIGFKIDYKTENFIVSAKQVCEELGKIPQDAELNVYINSNGGDVFEGAAIATQIGRHKGKVTGYVDGAAHSAAFNILQACRTRVMHAGTAALVHNPWTCVVGNQAEMRKAAQDLDAISESIKAMIVQRTNGKTTLEELARLMDDETMLTPEMALEHGFIDRVESTGKPVESKTGPETSMMRKDTIKDFMQAFGLQASDRSETTEEAVSPGQEANEDAGPEEEPADQKRTESKGIAAYFDKKRKG